MFVGGDNFYETSVEITHTLFFRASKSKAICLTIDIDQTRREKVVG